MQGLPVALRLLADATVLVSASQGSSREGEKYVNGISMVNIKALEFTISSLCMLLHSITGFTRPKLVRTSVELDRVRRDSVYERKGTER